MNKLIFLILFLILYIPITFSQSVFEIGMTKEEIIDYNKDTCFSDTLDIGSHFIKAQLEDNINFIYYVFREDDTCFCVVLYFENYSYVKKFKDTLNAEFTQKNKNLWVSSDNQYFIYYEEDSLNIDLPVFYLWSDNVLRPKEWSWLDDYK